MIYDNHFHKLLVFTLFFVESVDFLSWIDFEDVDELLFGHWE